MGNAGSGAVKAETLQVVGNRQTVLSWSVAVIKSGRWDEAGRRLADPWRDEV